MNWGYKILMVIIVFLGGMAFMIQLAMRQKNEMVDEQYYQKELRYQKIIDAEQNYKNLKQSIQLSEAGNKVIIEFPALSVNLLQNGSIEFLRSSDQSKDTTISIQCDKDNKMYIAKEAFITGEYTARFNWINNDIRYYTQEKVFIQP